MPPISARFYPLGQTFDTMQAAVQHSLGHPLQAAARRDAARLRDAVFIDACWSPSVWWLRFDSGLTLRVWADPAAVHWSLGPSPGPADADEDAVERVGAAPVTFQFEGLAEPWPMDPSALVAKRRGARLTNLFVNDFGLWVYLRGHLILQFGCAERTADGRSILYVLEDD